MKVTVLSGGVGGARFVSGVVDAVEPRDVTVVGNVGDDLEVLGLHVSPDLDSILYALAGVNDEERGWGRAGETWRALETVEAVGGESWFRLGDLDLGLHLVRTQALRAGEQLSTVTGSSKDPVRQAPHRECSTRSPTPSCCCSHRATRMCRLRRFSRSARFAPRSLPGVFRALR